MTLEQALALRAAGLHEMPAIKHVWDTHTIGALFAFYGRCKKTPPAPKRRAIDGTCGHRS